MKVVELSSITELGMKNYDLIGLEYFYNSSKNSDYPIVEVFNNSKRVVFKFSEEHSVLFFKYPNKEGLGLEFVDKFHEKLSETLTIYRFIDRSRGFIIDVVSESISWNIL